METRKREVAFAVIEASWYTSSIYILGVLC